MTQGSGALVVITIRMVVGVVMGVITSAVTTIVGAGLLGGGVGPNTSPISNFGRMSRHLRRSSNRCLRTYLSGTTG